MTVNYPTQKKKKKPTSPRSPVRPADVPRRKTMAKPRPVRPEDGMIDKNIAYLKPKKLGRPPKTIEEQLDEASEAFMLKVVKGESFEFAGLTGKRCHGPAPVETRARVAANWLKKRRPDLTATMIQAKVQTETVDADDDLSDRDLARMISAMVFESQIGTTAETKAIAAPDYLNTPPWEPSPGPEAEEKDAALSVGLSPRRELPDPENPKSGDRWDCQNGSHLRYYEGPSGTQGRFNVLDSANVLHATCYSFDKSIKIAQGLPEPTGAHQIDPWELDRAASEQVQALDRRKEAEPLGAPTHIRNIQRDPRPAWKPRRSHR